MQLGMMGPGRIGANMVRRQNPFAPAFAGVLSQKALE